MKVIRTILIVFSIFSYEISTKAQQATTASGGDASGSGGKASYSIGQVIYTTNSGQNGTITQGVQQPYEVFVVSGIEEAKGISIECIVYPNPANSLVNLKIEASSKISIQSTSYALYDLSGKLLQNKKTESQETVISMSNLSPSIYFLKISDNTKEIKVFKIIKN